MLRAVRISNGNEVQMVAPSTKNELPRSVKLCLGGINTQVRCERPKRNFSVEIFICVLLLHPFYANRRNFHMKNPSDAVGINLRSDFSWMKMRIII